VETRRLLQFHDVVYFSEHNKTVEQILIPGCGHSKIARVPAYNLYCMCLAVLTSLQTDENLTEEVLSDPSRKSGCHENLTMMSDE